MNLVLIAAIVTLLWLASLALYIYTSRQQREIQADIETVKRMLNDDDGGEASDSV